MKVPNVSVIPYLAILSFFFLSEARICQIIADDSLFSLLDFTQCLCKVFQLTPSFFTFILRMSHGLNPHLPPFGSPKLLNIKRFLNKMLLTVSNGDLCVCSNNTQSNWEYSLTIQEIKCPGVICVFCGNLRFIWCWWDFQLEVILSGGDDEVLCLCWNIQLDCFIKTIRYFDVSCLPCWSIGSTSWRIDCANI